RAVREMLQQPVPAPEPQATPAQRSPKGSSNRFWMPDAIFDQRLSPQVLAIYAYLCRRAGRSRVCWPSVLTIAKTCRVKRDTAIAALDELEARTMVRGRKRYHDTTVYTITLPEEWKPSSQSPSNGILTPGMEVSRLEVKISHLAVKVSQTGQRRTLLKELPEGQ